jgi:hypothetical protein
MFQKHIPIIQWHFRKYDHLLYENRHVQPVLPFLIWPVPSQSPARSAAPASETQREIHELSGQSGARAFVNGERQVGGAGVDAGATASNSKV